MRPLKDLLLELFKGLQLGWAELPVDVDALLDHLHFAWNNNFFVDVSYQRFDEGRANALDAFLKPDIVVEELTFSSQDAEFDCEVVVRAVDDLDQAVLDLLGDVKDSVEV